MELVGIEQIRQAAKNLADVAVRTPLLPQLWADADRPLWLKPESLQPIGAFKIRGAYHAIAALPAQVRARGVITHSSGNHGQAVAYAAARFDIPAVVVIPKVAPAVKVDAVCRLGAEVVLVDGGERLEAAEKLAAERDLTLIAPFDHPDVIAGQGSVGVKAIRPRTAVYGVEPDVAPDARDSLAAGRIVPYTDEQRYATIADGMRTHLSELTLAHLRANLDGIVPVTEDEIRAAVGMLARDANLVAEP